MDFRSIWQQKKPPERATFNKIGGSTGARTPDLVHVKDALFATGEVVPAGTGVGHLPEIFQKLDASGYHGFLSLEPHLANFSGLAALEHNAAIRTENNTEKAFCVAWEAFQKVLG